MWRFTTFSCSVYLRFQTFETLIQKFAKKLSYHKLNSKCIPEEAEEGAKPWKDAVSDTFLLRMESKCRSSADVPSTSAASERQRAWIMSAVEEAGGVKESVRVRGGKRVFVKAKGATQSSELRRMRRGNWGKGREGGGGREEKPLQWDGCTWGVNEHADPLIRLAN